MPAVVPDPVIEMARYLARSGHHDQALELLRRTSDTCSEVLMLKGKIFFQQGEVERALDCWQQVPSDEPQHAAAQAAINQARRTRRRLAGRLYRFSLGYCATLLAAALIVLVLVTLAGSMAAGRWAGAPAVAPADKSKERPVPPDRQLAAIHRRLQALDEAVGSLRADPPQAAAVMDQLQRLDQRVDELQVAQQGLLDKLDQLDQNTAQLLQHLDDRISSLPLASLRAQLGLVEKQARQLDVRAAQLTVLQQLLGGRMARLETALAEAALPSDAAAPQSSADKKPPVAAEPPTLDQRLDMIERRLQRYRLYQLITRAVAITHRSAGQLSSDDYAALHKIADEILSNSTDKSTQRYTKYAKELRDWIEQRHPASR